MFYFPDMKSFLFILCYIRSLLTFFRCFGEMLPKTSTQLCVLCSKGSGESVSVSLFVEFSGNHLFSFLGD